MTQGLYILVGPRQWRAAIEAVKACMPDASKPWEVRIKRYRPKRTNPQNRTMWMWHSEFAAHLSQTTDKLWSSQEVHDYLFLPVFCPHVDVVLPNGERRPIPRGSSDLDTAEMTEAMESYQAWLLGMGVELTEPIDDA